MSFQVYYGICVRYLIWWDRFWIQNQVYRVSDMELVSVLPSAEDEVNVACFHPFSGGGIVYGTKVCIPLCKAYQIN